MEMKREQRLITEKYDFLEKTSHTAVKTEGIYLILYYQTIQRDSQILIITAGLKVYHKHGNLIRLYNQDITGIYTGSYSVFIVTRKMMNFMKCFLNQILI